MHFDDLKKSQDENKFLEEKFKSDRENLELKYQRVLEENIRRERLKISELLKQRMANAAIADNARKNSIKGVEPIINSENDEIQDRIPILDAILNKWNHIIKIKKQMINKYLINSKKIKDNFEKLLLFLGLEKYEELPVIYSMEEVQTTFNEDSIDELVEDGEVENVQD